MPTKAQIQLHHLKCLSPRHAARMARGEKESKPEDYSLLDRSEDGKRLRDARWGAEDRRMMRELGLV